MLSKKITFLATATFAMALASGCHLYIEDDGGSDDDGWDDSGDWVQPGDDCSADADICAPGCVCTGDPFGSSFCEETGFCDDEFPCPDGFTCGRDADGDGINETCIPGDEPPPPPECEVDSNCTLGDICSDAGDCGAAAECADHSSKASCDADPVNDCNGVNRGINCTHPTGGDCELDPTPCTCESFEFVACVDTSVET